MATSASPWQASAAYLYLLHLDDTLLAWEYLRRNPRYRQAYQHAIERGGRGASTHWGLQFAEDPSLDARSARPCWISGRWTTVRIDEQSPAPAGARTFSLWYIPGPKDLLHDGERLTLIAAGGLRISLSAALSDQAFYAVSVSAAANLRRCWAMIERLSRLSGAPTVPGLCVRPKHRAILNMRCLQALDGFLCGATHRQIGEFVFEGRGPGKRWHADSGLRTQVRSLIRRGQEFMNGGYLRLVGLDPGEIRKT